MTESKEPALCIKGFFANAGLPASFFTSVGEAANGSRPLTMHGVAAMDSGVVIGWTDLLRGGVCATLDDALAASTSSCAENLH
jgi:hypothetical protein